MRLVVAAAALGLSACSPPSASRAEPERAEATVQINAAARAAMERVNAARFAADAQASAPSLEGAPAQGAPGAPARIEAYDSALIRVQVLLDRLHFSPGVIDGHDGENVGKAVRAYQEARGLPVDGVADEELLTRLEGEDAEPALITYVITREDTRGPFVNVPTSLRAMSRLRRLGYESAAEGLAEKFHMDEDLLRALNPGVNFGRPGAEIVVAKAGGELSGAVASIEIDKSEGALRAFDASHQMLAYYPVTIGSPESPAPTGAYEVRGVALNPTYRYDPSRLPSFGDRGHGPVTIAAGPNNPVGAVWIALSLDTYGIHGAPEPSLVSKTQSHGCVRLTNWDAVELAHAVQPGVPVTFMEEGGDVAIAAPAEPPEEIAPEEPG